MFLVWNSELETCIEPSDYPSADARFAETFVERT